MSPQGAEPGGVDPDNRIDAGSYRDPGNRVFMRGGEVYRALDERALSSWRTLAGSRVFRDGVAAGTIVATEATDSVTPPGDGQWAGVLHHERIPAVSYPFEWTFTMLQRAALLQLDLLAAALQEDMILKDSTPYNIQWRGTQPVFIDIGSFERLEAGDVWVGYRQFLQQYLYPLMLTAHVGVPFQPWLRGNPEGITADELRRVLPTHRLVRKAGLLHVALPAFAERRYRGRGRNVRSELKSAGFGKELIEANVRGLRRTVERLVWEPGESRWNRYAADCAHVAAQREAKSDFVARYAATHAPGLVWDVGANDGHFSKLVADVAGYVLALDGDVVVLDELYRSASADGASNVLPLVQDVTDPSPGIGWRGAERPALIERASPDLVLCLAVVHHLVVGRNVPLVSVVDWLADIHARVILEFVPLDDPMVQELTANKRPHEIHGDYNEASLRQYLAERFVIDDEAAVPEGGRLLFALSPRNGR